MALARGAIGLGLWLLTGTALAQVPKDQLAKPPADARHFVILSTGGKHGDSWMWTAPDGALMGRESMVLRGQVWEIDSSGAAGKDGMPARLDIRGVTPQGDAGETFSVTGGNAQWKSQIDAGSAAYAKPAFYASVGGPMAINAWFVERLLASSNKAMDLLPGGRATAEKMTTLDVGEGASRQTITLWAIYGISNSPLPIWTDAQNRFFGVTFVIGWLPEAYTSEMPKMEAAQSAAMAARMPALAQSLVTVPAGPVAFTHVKLFDADGLKFLPDQSVVVANGKIAAVGPAASVKLPAGAKVIDGKGKTLVPGMWDVHMHIGDDYTLLQELSLGITSIRDPGNNDKLTIDRRTRAAAGKLLSPHVYPSSLIDGKGPNTAQVANVATSQDEAIGWVRKAKENGFTGVKFYGTFNPAWLKASIDEAHKLGLHVHGHVPQGIRPLDAVNAGYDELTHINWIVMQGMPDSVIQTSNGIMRFEGPGRYAKDLNLDGPEMSGWVKTLADRHIYSDPTMVAFESLYVPENGDLSPSYAPFVGTLPPVTERGFRSGGFQVPKDLTRADYRKSWAKMVDLLGRMHKAGVPIAAGTDGNGIEIIHELEIYREAGFTPAEALAAATIVPARLVGVDKTTGSIAVGKTADLVLVEGDPEARIGDLRQTRMVVMDGKLMDADALRKAAGYSGRPK
ncbi:amidohydrolase family protein [Sphingomonas tabacisoli]|uniref:Amidohydrolase family protein n=1 Tax=Sphingomonas tabacisoli TaxID=2249466 RepID=A0ABW4I3A4_9SPHN